MSDIDVVKLWVQQHSRGTAVEYSRHGRRIVGWLHSVGESLRSCSVSELSDYFDQLADPQLLRKHIALFVPEEHQHEFAKLFAIQLEPGIADQKLGAQRAERTRKVLIAFFAWLHKANFREKQMYVPTIRHDDDDDEGATEPAEKKTEAREPNSLTARVLTDAQWAIIDAATQQIDTNTVTGARRFVVAVWLRESGVRRQELAAARLDHFTPHSTKDSGVLWLWEVRGKGNKPRNVPVNAAMLDAYRRYRIARGLPFFDHEPFVSPPSGHFAAGDKRLFYGAYGAPKPVSVFATPEAIRDGLHAAIDLAKLKKNHKKLPVNLRGMTHTQAYNDVRALAKAAVAIATEKKDKHAIANLTPHFFRHRRALDLLKRGLRLTQLKQYLGHSSIETTTAYTNQEAIDLAVAVLALDVKS